MRECVIKLRIITTVRDSINVMLFHDYFDYCNQATSVVFVKSFLMHPKVPGLKGIVRLIQMINLNADLIIAINQFCRPWYGS